MINKLFSIILITILAIPSEVSALRPVATGASNMLETLSKVDVLHEQTEMADGYNLIKYQDNNFRSENNKNGLRKATAKKIWRVIGASAIFVGLFVAVNYLTGIVFGHSLIVLYAELYAKHSFIVAGATAAITGAIAELTGLYISDNPSRRYKLASRFATIILFRLLILGPTASMIDVFVESVLPKATATPFLLGARVAISMAHGMFMSSLVQIFVPYYYQRRYAESLKEKGKIEEASRILREYTLRQQLKKAINSIWARLPFVFIQHDIVQNIFAYNPSGKILSRFGIGFLMGLFRSWVANRKKSSLQAKVFVYGGLVVSLMSFFWGSELIGFVVVLTSGIIYLFNKGRVVNRTEALCLLLNKAGKFLSGHEFSYLKVVKELFVDAHLIEESDGKLSMLISENYAKSLLSHNDKKVAISDLEETLNDVILKSRKPDTGLTGGNSEATGFVAVFDIERRLKHKKITSKSSSAGEDIIVRMEAEEEGSSRDLQKTLRWFERNADTDSMLPDLRSFLLSSIKISNQYADQADSVESVLREGKGVCWEFVCLAHYILYMGRVRSKYSIDDLRIVEFKGWSADNHVTLLVKRQGVWWMLDNLCLRRLEGDDYEQAKMDALNKFAQGELYVDVDINPQIRINEEKYELSIIYNPSTGNEIFFGGSPRVLSQIAQPMEITSSLTSNSDAKVNATSISREFSVRTTIASAA